VLGIIAENKEELIELIKFRRIKSIMKEIEVLKNEKYRLEEELRI
jgi:hypothetical protein